MCQALSCDGVGDDWLEDLVFELEGSNGMFCGCDVDEGRLCCDVDAWRIQCCQCLPLESSPCVLAVVVVVGGLNEWLIWLTFFLQTKTCAFLSHCRSSIPKRLFQTGRVP